MIEVTTRWQTRDGKLHESENAARKHVITTLENAIGPIIDKTGIGISDRMKVVEALVGTVENAQILAKILIKML